MWFALEAGLATMLGVVNTLLALFPVLNFSETPGSYRGGTRENTGGRIQGRYTETNSFLLHLFRIVSSTFRARISLKLSKTLRSSGFNAHSQRGLRQMVVGLLKKLQLEITS